MTLHTSSYEGEREQRAAIVMGLLLTCAGLLATMYGLSMMAGLIVTWLAAR